MDVFILPTLLVAIIAFIVYVCVTWLADKEGRALRINDEYDETDAKS